jgi:hypothetical protein
LPGLDTLLQRGIATASIVAKYGSLDFALRLQVDDLGDDFIVNDCAGQ